jgi:carboxypeptidase Q
MTRKMFAPLLVLGLVVATPLAQQAEKIDQDVNARIRKEGMDNSQIAKTMHYLTDVYGPRLTGSPNHENAAKWAVKQMESWGMRNGQLHAFDFGRVGNDQKFVRQGWLNEKASGHIISPVKDNLVFEVLAWTPSTKGTVTGQVVHIIAPQGPVVETPAGGEGAGRGGGRGGQGGPQRLGPTQEELDKYLASLAPRMKSAMVMVGGPTVVPFQETAPAKRTADDVARARYNPDPNAPAAAGGRQGNPPAQPQAGGRGAQAAAPAGPPRLTPAQVNNAINAFVLKSGAAMRLNDAGRAHGQITAFNGAAYDPAQNLPTAVLRNEDYGRIARIVADGTPVTLEFNIQNRMYPEGKTSYNALAEIPGTDKADEVVMLGGHLDSWHSATGATDNAIGCAVMMEAARILQAIGVKPRRTIRVALWGGEEQGLIGSQAYVRDTFGSAENPKPAWHKFNGYFNVDSGTGRIRGGSVFGPPESARVVGEFLKQFEDLGVYGAMTTNSRGIGGSDHTAFNNAGLPGIGLNQDTIEYGSHTWHTNLDTYERIVWDDVKKSAVAIASAVYHLANREQMLPRFAPDQMPALPGGRGGGAPTPR